VVALGGVRIKGVPQIRVDAEKGMEMIVRHVAALIFREGRFGLWDWAEEDEHLNVGGPPGVT